jgi:hypothetical protein
MFRINLDKAPIEALENELDKFGERTFPHAVRDTLNITAFEASFEAKKFANHIFTMRNQYTTRSIRYERARGSSVNQMSSAVGSVQDYMREQEEGFTRTTRGKHGLAVPTGYAAGQDGARTRTKPIRRSNWLQRLKIARSKRGAASVRQEIVQAAQEAVSTGRRTVWLPLRHPGLYRIVGGRRGTRGWPRGANLKMLYSTEDRTLRTESHQWMEPSVRVIMTRQDEYWRRALLHQIEINRQFKNRR